MELLFQHENEKYILDKKFDIKYLLPISHYVQWKLENNFWDDYNELFHATKLTEILKKDVDVWIDSHVFYRNDILTGVLLIVGGKLKKLETKYFIENEDQSLLLKYFHIIDKGQGFGRYWINSIIIPYYKERGYRHIYVNSSHEKSFPFYKELGSLIASYEQISDNNLYFRNGNCFLINL